MGAGDMAYVMADIDFEQFTKTLDELIEDDSLSVKARSLVALMLVRMGHLVHVDEPENDDEEMIEAVVATNAAFASLLDHLKNEMGGVVMGKTNGVPWFFVDEMAPAACGLIPSFLHVDDERPMIEQINARYIGGWHRFEGFKLKKKNWMISFPGDPDMTPLGGAALHGEVIVVYPYAWVMIIQNDHSF